MQGKDRPFALVAHVTNFLKTQKQFTFGKKHIKIRYVNYQSYNYLKKTHLRAQIACYEL